jgi:hypothetical protein
VSLRGQFAGCTATRLGKHRLLPLAGDQSAGRRSRRGPGTASRDDRAGDRGSLVCRQNPAPAESPRLGCGRPGRCRLSGLDRTRRSGSNRLLHLTGCDRRRRLRSTRGLDRGVLGDPGTGSSGAARAGRERHRKFIPETSRSVRIASSIPPAELADRDSGRLPAGDRAAADRRTRRASAALDGPPLARTARPGGAGSGRQRGRAGPGPAVGDPDFADLGDRGRRLRADHTRPGCRSPRRRTARGSDCDWDCGGGRRFECADPATATPV